MGCWQCGLQSSKYAMSSRSIASCAGASAAPPRNVARGPRASGMPLAQLCKLRRRLGAPPGGVPEKSSGKKNADPLLAAPPPHGFQPAAFFSFSGTFNLAGFGRFRIPEKRQKDSAPPPTSPAETAQPPPHHQRAAPLGVVSGLFAGACTTLEMTLWVARRN